MTKLDDLLEEVGRQTTVEQGIVTLIDKLRADVLAAGGDTAKIEQAFNAVKSNTDALASKLTENTPAEAPTA